MPITRNGVEFFATDEDAADHPATRLLATVSLGDVHFPYGFFIREEDGKPFVLPATEEQWLDMLGKAFPERARDSWENRCRTGSGGRCTGRCRGLSEICMRGFESEHVQFACACIRPE